MALWCLIFLCVHAKLALSDNVGWKAFFTENIDEFHDLPLQWEDKTLIPSWVTGTFVRNGAARTKFDSPRRAFSSWLDGWAKLHSFKFNGSRVLFSGKMLETPNYLASVKKGELTPQMTLNKFENSADEWTWWEWGQIAYKMATGTGYDNSNPVVWRLGPKDPKKGIYLATTDDPVATRFDIDTLDTLGIEYPKALPPTVSGCAHYMREPGTDNSININGKIGLTGPYYEVQRWKPGNTYQEPEVIAKFKPRASGYFHSFSITEHHVVLFNYPVSMDPAKLFSGFHIFEGMKSDRKQPVDIYIIDLKTGHVTTRTTEYVFSLHHANAYETEDEIIVDLVSNKFENLREYTNKDNMMNPPAVWNHSATNDMNLYRYRIGLKTKDTKDVKVTTFEDKFPVDRFLHHFEFPIINEEYRGKHYCILYGWSAYLYSRNVLVKKNLCDDSLSKTLYIENHYSGEMFFIANPEKKAEDDGILIATIFDGEIEQSYLLVLDAKSFKPINKSYLPHNIPMSFHGMYFPEAQLGASEK